LDETGETLQDEWAHGRKIDRAINAAETGKKQIPTIPFEKKNTDSTVERQYIERERTRIDRDFAGTGQREKN